VAANGGSDLDFIPDGDRELAPKVVAIIRRGYVSGLFCLRRSGCHPGNAADFAIF
jgi:hypothetical protein